MEICADAVARHAPFRVEYRLRRHDGEYRWMVDTGMPRRDAAGAVLGYIGSCIDVTDLKLAKAALSSLSHRLMQTHEGERESVAEELHEDLAQRLAGLTMQLHSVSQATPDGNARALVEQSLRGVRRSRPGHPGDVLPAVLLQARVSRRWCAAIRAICRE